MEPITNLALTMILSVATNFQAGLEALAHTNAAAAVAPLTRVIDAQPAVTDLVDLALVHRAGALLQLQKTNEAWADLKRAATTSASVPVRRDATARFKLSGGDPKALLPAAGPKKTWEEFMAAGRRRDVPAALRCLTPEMQKVLRVMEAVMAGQGEEDALADFIENAITGEASAEQIDVENGRAVVTVSEEDDPDVPVEFTVGGDRWLISGIASERKPVAAAPQVRVVGRGLVQVNGEVMVMGQAVQQLGGMQVVRQQINFRVAEPEAKPAAVEQPVELSAERQAEVRALIEKLGAPDAADRAAARAQLAGLGALARSILNERRDHPDPEIATTVRELLEKIAP